MISFYLKENDMATKLEAAAKQDYDDYKTQLAALEKEKKAVEKKFDDLHKNYAAVLDYMGIKPIKKTRAPSRTRAKRGQTRILIAEALKNADNSLRAHEIIKAISGQASAAAVRQQLPKLMVEGAIKKNADKTYTLKGTPKKTK